MNSSTLNKIIDAAEKEGRLPLESLDAILASDSAFGRNMKKLDKRLDHRVRVEIPLDHLEQDGNHPRPFRGAPAYSAGRDSYFHYMREIRQWPRMTREDEYLHSKRLEFFKHRLIQCMRKSGLTRDSANLHFQNLPCLGKKDSVDIAPVCSTNGSCPRGKTRALKTCCQCYNTFRAIFVERNLHIVVDLVAPYKTYGPPMIDLIQEGNTALIRAVEMYDWRKQVRFRTYAAFWVRQAVERYISNTKGIVRIPNYIQQKMRRFKREGKLAAGGETISAEAVSEAFELPSVVARHLVETERKHLSLDVADCAEILLDEPDDVVMDCETADMKKKLLEALDCLTEQERKIVTHRFGIGKAEFKTLDELGVMMKVSRERIRQILLRALKRLRKPGLAGSLKGFV